MNEEIFMESLGLNSLKMSGIYKDYIILSGLEVYLKQSNNLRNFDGNQTIFELMKYAWGILFLIPNP